MKRSRSIPGGVAILSALVVFLLWHGLAPQKHPESRGAERGDVQAMYRAGTAHLTASGDGSIQHPTNEEAIYWLRKASEQGHCGAMWTISRLGIPNEEKVKWLKKGAELGSESCIIELMNGYCFGRLGLPKDMGAAIFWELKRGALYLKRDRKTPLETYLWLAKWEHRFRKENNYDGPVRPLP